VRELQPERILTGTPKWQMRSCKKRAMAAGTLTAAKGTAIKSMNILASRPDDSKSICQAFGLGNHVAADNDRIIYGISRK
jgi:hypothetical protein